MTAPLVSVIIPTLPSREPLLERSVSSVKKQTYNNIETFTITHGKNACEARNIGIRKASGEFIAFLDDDDEWLPTKIEEQVNFLISNPSVGLVSCWIDDRRFSNNYIDKYPIYASRKEIIDWMRFSSTSSYMIRKSLLDKIGLFDASLPSAQEYDLAIRCSEQSLVACIQETLVIQNKTDNQITKDSKKKVKGLQMIYAKHCRTEPLKTKIKFKMAIIMYKIQPYMGKSIEKLVVKYKNLL